MAIKLAQNISAIKIDPLDVNDKVAVGIKFPFNKKRIFDLDYTTKDHAKSKLINVLLTSPGERINQPLFGVGLKNKLFQQQTLLTEDEIRSSINPQVERYVPEISINNISFSRGGLQGHVLNININYIFANTNEEDSVSLKFEQQFANQP